MTNSVHKVTPSDPGWKDLPEEEKESFYRHNYIRRPEVMERANNQNTEDPLLKVVRNWIGPDDDEQEALVELKKTIKEKRDQVSKAGGKTTKNGQKI